MAKHKVTTSFEQGFNIKGFSPQDLGSDIIRGFKTPETWTGDDEKNKGTPIQIDTDPTDQDSDYPGYEQDDRYIKLCPDGEKPDGYLYVNVADELSDKDMMMGLYGVDEVRAGEPADYVKHVEGAFLNTNLLHGTNTPDTVGDDVYIEDGLFSTDEDDDEQIGEVIEVNDDFVVIKLV